MKRFISLLLTAVMIFALVPVSTTSISAVESYTDTTQDVTEDVIEYVTEDVTEDDFSAIYTDEQGVTYTMDENWRCVITDFDDSTEDVIIPDSVYLPEHDRYVYPSNIADSAFNACTTLKTISLPIDFNFIGDFAFYGCTNLMRVDAKTISTLGQYCFAECTSLESVSHQGIKYISDFAFSNCASLKDFYLEGLIDMTIGSFAFEGCTSLETLDFSRQEDAYVLGSSVFSGCTNLSEIRLYDEHQPHNWSSDWLAGCDATLVYENKYTGDFDSSPFYTDEQGVTYMLQEDGTCVVTHFNDMTEHVCIPHRIGEASVTGIADNAFEGCSYMKTIDIRGEYVHEIGEYAFWGCIGLTEVNAQFVRSISDYAFANCSSLTKFYHNDELEYIGKYAFADCSSLHPFQFGARGNMYVDEYAFSNCTSFEYLELIECTGATLGSMVFDGCENLYEICLLNKYQTENWADDWLGNCNATITYREEDESIDSSSMDESLGEEPPIEEPEPDVSDDDTSIDYDQVPFEFVYTLSEDGTYYILSGYSGRFGTDVIRSEIDGIPVKEIGDSALSRTDLTHIDIPDSITTICDSAFAYCDELTSVTFGSNVTTLGNDAFYNCSSLTSIVLPDSVVSIGNYTFSNCTSLNSVIFGENVTAVGDGAFSSCTSLTTLVLNDKLTHIGYGAFDNCIELTEVTLPASLEEVGMSAFSYCSNLSDVTLSEGIRRIGNNAFSSCSSLTSITLPESLTSIGEYAFYHSGLQSIHIPANVEFIERQLFSGCPYLISVTVSADNPTYHSDNNCIIETATNTLVTGATTALIPDYVTAIADYAFAQMYITSPLTIPSSVTSIGAFAFFETHIISSIVIPETVLYVGFGAFALGYDLEDIYIEAESLPDGWDIEWEQIPMGGDGYAHTTIHWGYVSPEKAERQLNDAISDADSLDEKSYDVPHWEDILIALDFAKAYDATDKSVEDIQSVTEALDEIIAGKPLIKGDADRDGTVDQFDYLVIKRGFFNTYTLYTGDLLRADIDGSSSIDQFDYLVIKRVHFGTYTIG